MVVASLSCADMDVYLEYDGGGLGGAPYLPFSSARWFKWEFNQSTSGFDGYHQSKDGKTMLWVKHSMSKRRKNNRDD